MRNQVKHKTKGKLVGVFGKRISWSNLLLVLLITLLSFLSIRKLTADKKAMEQFATTTCKIVWVGRTAGNRFGQPECNCELVINGKTETRNFESKALKLKVGDCINVKYSTVDTSVSVPDYDSGIVNCRE